MTNKQTSVLCLLVSLLTLSIFLSGCKPESNGVKAVMPIGENNVLRVGVSTNAPPIIFRQNNTVSGLEASLAIKFGKFLNKKIVFVEVPWGQQLEYLNQGKTDIVMSGMTITPQRTYLANFIEPYLRSGQILLVRLQDRRKFSRGILDVMNKKYKIGTIADTTGDFFVTETISNAHEINFKTSKQGVQALVDKKIDVLVYDAPMVCHYAAINHKEKLVPILVMATEEYLAWAVRKKDNELNQDAHRFLKTIKENGELRREINTWIPYLNG